MFKKNDLVRVVRLNDDAKTHDAFKTCLNKIGKIVNVFYKENQLDVYFHITNPTNFFGTFRFYFNEVGVVFNDPGKICKKCKKQNHR